MLFLERNQTVGAIKKPHRVEKRGDGVPIILDESEKLSGKKPVYKLIDDSELGSFGNLIGEIAGWICAKI